MYCLEKKKGASLTQAQDPLPLLLPSDEKFQKASRGINRNKTSREPEGMAILVLENKDTE